MNLTASESKRLTALRAKANLSDEEAAQLEALEAKAAATAPSGATASNINTSTYTEANVLVSHAAALPVNARGRVIALVIALRDCASIGLAAPKNVLTFSQKQFERMCAGFGINPSSPSAVRQFISAIGTDRTRVKLMLEHYKKGSTYESNGVVVVREKDGINANFQAFIIADYLSKQIDTGIARSLEREWSSGSHTAPVVEELTAFED